MKLKMLLMATCLLLPMSSAFAESIDEHIASLKKEADIGNTEAKKKLDQFLAQLHGLEDKVKAGDPKAKYDLAELYSKYSDRTTASADKFMDLMRQSANQGYIKAERQMLHFALMHSGFAIKQQQDKYGKHDIEKEKQDVDKAYQEVMKWANKLLAKKDAETAYLLGEAYDSGNDGLQRNYYKAKEMYAKAVSFGSLYAIEKLADYYKQGLGVEKNIPKAISLYEEAAKKGDARGYGELAYMYEKGDGVPKDAKKAQEYRIKEDNARKCESSPSSCQSSSK